MNPLFQHCTIPMRRIALVLFTSLLVACAPSKVRYYKPGGSQHKFDQDARACSEWAQMMARGKMAHPDGSPDPGLVQSHFEECIYGRGWSQIPLDQRDRSLWKYGRRRVAFADFEMEIPRGFTLRTESKWVVGPTWSHQLKAVGPDGQTFLMLVAQESVKKKIQRINYPRPQGFVLYTSGRLDRYDIRWSVFAGRYKQDLIAILGAYIYLEKKRRISLVFSRPLVASGKPDPGYTLSSAQKQELEGLYSTWVSWIKAQTGSKERVEKPGLRQYLRFLWEQ